jgi:hypothetical protein
MAIKECSEERYDEMLEFAANRLGRQRRLARATFWLHQSRSRSPSRNRNSLLIVCRRLARSCSSGMCEISSANCSRLSRVPSLVTDVQTLMMSIADVFVGGVLCTRSAWVIGGLSLWFGLEPGRKLDTSPRLATMLS